MNIISAKAEGECHSSIFFGLFENEKINKRHVVTIRNTAKNKGGKQDCVNLEAFLFDCTLYQSLKNMEVVLFL
jgi:hypothetical protein